MRMAAALHVASSRTNASTPTYESSVGVASFRAAIPVMVICGPGSGARPSNAAISLSVGMSSKVQNESSRKLFIVAAVNWIGNWRRILGRSWCWKHASVFLEIGVKQRHHLLGNVDVLICV